MEFNTVNLARDVLEHNGPINIPNLTTSDLWVKVDYKTQVTRLSPEAYYRFITSGPPSADDRENSGAEGIRQFLEGTLKTKHTVWRLENEWRLLWTSDSGDDVYQCPMSKDSLVGIYLGLRIDATTKEELLEAFRSRIPGTAVSEARKVDGNFALEWRRIL